MPFKEPSKISLSARTPARDPAPPVAGERETLVDLREQPQPPDPGTDLEPVTVLEGEIVDPPDPRLRAALPAMRAAAPDITEDEAAQILDAFRSERRATSIVALIRSPAGRDDIVERLAAIRQSAAMWADAYAAVAAAPEPCTDCRGGYLGMDEDFRPKPCPRCRPHLVRTTA